MKWLSKVFGLSEEEKQNRNRDTFEFTITPLTPENKTPTNPIRVRANTREELEEVYAAFVDEDEPNTPPKFKSQWGLFKFSTTLDVGDKDVTRFKLNWLLRLSDYVLTPIVRTSPTLALAEYYEYSALIPIALLRRNSKNFSEYEMSWGGEINGRVTAAFLAVNLGEEQKYQRVYNPPPEYMEDLPELLENLEIGSIFPKSVRLHKAIFDSKKAKKEQDQYDIQIEELLSGQENGSTKFELGVGIGTFLLLTAKEVG